MGTLAYERRGHGEFVVLLHGTGSSHRVWRPVIDAIAETREVIAVDNPGCGDSPQLDGDVTPDRMAKAIAGLFDELGLEAPAVAGHSMGGWIALELAKLGRTGPVLAFAPAGLWRRYSPLGTNISLASSRLMGRIAGPLGPRVLRSPAGRAITLRPLTAHPRDVDPGLAIELARDGRASHGFWRHFVPTRRMRFAGGRSIDVPLEIVFGDSDRIAPAARSQNRHELPGHAVWETWPDCGHMVMWDAPDRVVAAVKQL